MTGYLRRFIVRYVLSPYGIALVPYCVFLFAWNFPPNTYTYYIHEPDLLYHNPESLLFYTACLLAFLIGVWVVGCFDSIASATAVPVIRLRAGSPLLYLAVPLLLAAIPCLIFMMLVGASMNVVALILSQQGDVMKNANVGGAGSGFWGSGLFLLTGVLWWAGYRASQLQLKGTSKRIFYAVFTGCFLVDLLTCLATFDRTNLMPLLAGSTIVFLFFKTRAENVKLGRLALIASCAAVLILGAFLALQFARGASRADAFITSMLGYTIVSYNRMAALVLGVMHYVYQGKGAYVVAFFLENGRFAGMRSGMGLPTSYGLWLSEFPSLSAAGLNSSYNWASVLGYVFSDLGWWTPLYIFGTGLFAGYLWSRFRAGSPFGIVFYPWLAFWILFWFGWNLLFDARGVVLIETAVLLAIYDRFCLRRGREVPQVEEPVLVPRSPWQLPRPVASLQRGGGS